MELGLHFSHDPFSHSSCYLRNPLPLLQFGSLPSLPARRRRLRRNRTPFGSFRAINSGSGNEGSSAGFSWERVSRSMKRGSERFWLNFSEGLKKETGLDPDVGKLVGRAVDALNEGKEAVDRFRLELVPAFVDWNRWENWRELNKLEPKRVGTLILYSIIITISCRRIYIAFTSYAYRQSQKELTEAYMEALIPLPTPTNVRKLKKGVWRKPCPKA